MIALRTGMTTLALFGSDQLIEFPMHLFDLPAHGVHVLNGLRGHRNAGHVFVDPHPLSGHSFVLVDFCLLFFQVLFWLSVVDEVEAVVVATLKRAERLRQAILRRAFYGRLVPQNPDDEPASALLERIRVERAAPSPGASKPEKREKPKRGIIEMPAPQTALPLEWKRSALPAAIVTL